MSKAAEAKKPSDSPKTKRPLGDEGSERQGRGFSMTQLAKIASWEGNGTRLELWEELLKDPIMALDKGLEVSRESPSALTSCSKFLRDSHTYCNELQFVGTGNLAKRCGKCPTGKAFWSCVDPWDSVRLRTASHLLECSR